MKESSFSKELIPIQELNMETYLKVAQYIFEQYQSFIYSLIGNFSDKKEYSNSDLEFIENIFPFDIKILKNTMLAELDNRENKFQKENYTAQKLLNQSKHNLELKEGTYELIKLHKGLYTLLIKEEELLSKLLLEAKGKAVFSGEIPFLMISNFLSKFEIEETIPHEIHHIIWRMIHNQGLLWKMPDDSADLDFSTDLDYIKASFSIYQDEIIAKLVTEDANISGYSIFKCLPKEKEEEAKIKCPEIVDYIENFVKKLNSQFMKLRSYIKHSSFFKEKYIMLAVICAENFDKLYENISFISNMVYEEVGYIVEREKEKREKERLNSIEDNTAGWCSIKI